MTVQVSLFDKTESNASRVGTVLEDAVGDGFDVKKFVENFEVLADAAGGTRQLRRIVVGLALSGRILTPKTVPRETLSNEDSSSELPSLPLGWMWISLESITTFGPKNGYSPRAVEHATKVKSLTLSATTSGRFDERFFKYIDEEISPESDLWLRDGDVLIQRGNTIDYVGVAAVYRGPPQTFIYPDLMMKIRLSEDMVDTDFVHLALNGPVAREFMKTRASGTSGTMPKINQATLQAVPVPLPPLAEQKRIVARVDQLMALIDDLEAKQTKQREVNARFTKASLDALTTAEGLEEFDTAWKRVVENFPTVIDRPEAVEDLRLSIMDLASAGRLVRQNETEPSATVMVAKKRLEIEKSLGKIQVPEEPGVLPQGWTWELLGNLGADPENPVQTGPFGAQLHRSDFVSEGVPVIAVGNLTGTGFTTEGLYFITAEKAASLSRYDIRAGDLLFARSGATTGKVCVAPPFVKDWRMTGHILRARLDSRLILPKLVVYWLWGSQVVRTQVMGNIRGGTRPGYNTSLLKTIVVPVPPLAEQERIVAKIDHMLKLCDDLEAKLRRAEERASKLVEAVVQEMVA